MNNLFFSLAAGSQGEIQFNSNPISLLPCTHVCGFAVLNQAAQGALLLLYAILQVIFLVGFYISVFSAEL